MSDWPGNGPSTPDNISRLQPVDSHPSGSSELTIASVMPEWFRLADDLAVRLSRSSKALVWLQGAPGSGKTSFLIDNVPRWPFASLWLDLRQECEVMASGERVMGMSEPPVLVLDDMSPGDLLWLISDPQHPASQIVPSHAGPILLASAAADRESVASLTARIGRVLQSMTLPPTSVDFRLSVLRARQPFIERRWGVRLSPEAMHRAAIGVSSAGVVETPGGALGWLKAAAARVAMMAKQGDPQLRAIDARVADLNRALLVAQARQEEEQTVHERLKKVEIERTAYLVDWHESVRKGELNRVDGADVDREIKANGAGAGSSDLTGRAAELDPVSIAEDA